MKPPWEWSEEDILALIANQVAESLTLDYKACDALSHTDGKRREISKDVSAFANSAGGTLVYGVIEANHAPTRLDVGYLPSDISKEWVEQVINSNIQRRIGGVRINPVRLTGPKAGKVLYVVSVPQSTRAPHMAADHRFYKRFNFESVPMEEYEVRDVAHRREAPDLKLELQWHTPVPGAPIIELLAHISNDSPEPANYVVVSFFLDARLTLIDSAGLGALQPPSDSLVIGEHGPIPVKVLSLNWGVPGKMPIWEGQVFRLTASPLKFGVPPELGEYTVGWRLAAPRMNEKRQYYHVAWDGSNIRIGERSLW